MEILYLFAMGAVVGFLFGLVPFVYSVKKNMVDRGIKALIFTTIGGAILGIFLAIPLSIYFLYKINKAVKEKEGKEG